MAGRERLRLAANCFLREEPSRAAAPLGVGKRGMGLACAGPARDGWLPVEYRGGIAWVAGRFVEARRSR